MKLFCGYETLSGSPGALSWWARESLQHTFLYNETICFAHALFYLSHEDICPSRSNPFLRAVLCLVGLSFFVREGHLPIMCGPLPLARGSFSFQRT